IMVFEVAGAAPAPVAAPAQAAAPAPAPKAEASAAAPAANDFQENNDYAHASPVVRRLAREFGVNLSKVKGTGRKSRILKEDVQSYVKDALKRLESGAAASG
ncbi:E3 binding domain-containing protein, partial [Vibrio alfacsensis]